MITLPSGIKKVEASDNATIDNFNRNDDLLDAKITEYDAHVADTDNPHNVTTTQIGAETPAGAQAKADAAETAAKTYTDTQIDGITPGAIGALPASAYTAADVLAKIKTVDGAGSGLDADNLRGIAGDRFIYGDNQRGTTGYSGDLNDIVKTGTYYATTSSTNKPGSNNGFVIHAQIHSDDNYSMQIFVEVGALNSYIRQKNSGSWGAWSKLWNGANDGAGSGLDADTLDGNHAAAFALLTGAAFTGVISFPNSVGLTWNNGNNSTIADLVNFPQLTSSMGLVRLFRNTNTTGDKYFQINKGDGTTANAFEITNGVITCINGNNDVIITSGQGDPNGNVTARVGSIYLRIDGGSGTALYSKESGDGTNTGWAAV